MSTRNLLLLAAAFGLGSCSTMYKSGQTPDDIYYSPAPAQQQRTAASNGDYYDNGQGDGDYVNVQTDQDRSAYSGEDNYLRMKVRNPNMWSSLDYYDPMMYSPYYGGGLGWGGGMYNPYMMNSFYSPYYGSGFGMGLGWGGLGFGYNSFYSPFYSPFYNPYYGYGGYGGYYSPIITKPGYSRPASAYGPRSYNLGRYSGASKDGQVNTSSRNAPVRVFRNNNNNTYVNPGNSGNTSPRSRSFDNGGSSNNRPSRTFESRSSDAPARSFNTPSSSGGSRFGGSSGGGGGSAPSRSPGRGGR